MIRRGRTRAIHQTAKGGATWGRVTIRHMFAIGEFLGFTLAAGDRQRSTL